MNAIERIKKILTSPKTEWEVIASEETTAREVLKSYLIFVALIPAIGSFIGCGVVGYKNMIGEHTHLITSGVRQALISFVGIIAGTYITAHVLNRLAAKFNSTANFDKAFQLVAYSYAPMCIAGILHIFPSLSSIAGIISMYGLYIFYLGIAPMMKTPEEKVTAYFLSVLIFVILIFLLLSMLLAILYF